MRKIIISVPDTDENKGAIASLLSLEGVQIETAADRPSADDDFLTLADAADLFGVNYHTFRHWVVDREMIPSRRPSGKQHGKIFVVRGDVKKLAGMYKRKLPGKRTRGVEVL